MNIDNIFAELDNWTHSRSPIPYIPANMVLPPPDLQVPPVFGMQQVRTEIYQLCKDIVAQPWYSVDSQAVEIGLGYNGSGHILWRLLFGHITTVEIDHNRVNSFANTVYNHYNKWLLGDGKSSFVIGSSTVASSVEKVYNNCNQVDFLFIDGDHSYKAVLADWLLYEPLVNTGGMIVFDDTVLPGENGGVPRLINELESGKFGKQYKIKHIEDSISVGIGYYIK